MTKLRIPVLPTAILLFLMGCVGRIVLHDYHNFETVMVSVFLASMLLPIYASFIVTISIMIASDIYLGYFGSSRILLFTYSGFMLVSFITAKYKNEIEGKFSAGTMYKFTSSGIIFALVYDTWTNFGVFWLSYTHTIDNLILVYILGIPFMIYHLLSSIVTFSLIGFPVYCTFRDYNENSHFAEKETELKG